MRSKFILVASALLFLGACSSEEPGTDAVTEEPIEDAAIVDTAPVVTDEISDEEAIPQAVEESGGEPDESEAQDKPIVLAQADAPAAPQDWKFNEGEHYQRMVPTQPTVGGADKVEVSEFFWYGCGHCLDFEPFISRWEEGIPPTVRFVRIPATWNPLVLLHGKLYYTEEVLVNSGKIGDPAAFRSSVFMEIQRRGNRLADENAIRDFFTRNGVSAEDFDNSWNSFEVAQKLRVAQDLQRRYAITGVPAMVVNGKYRSGKQETGTYPKLLEVVDELVAKESAR